MVFAVIRNFSVFRDSLCFVKASRNDEMFITSEALKLDNPSSSPKLAELETLRYG